MAETTPRTNRGWTEEGLSLGPSIQGKGHTKELQDLKGWGLGSSPINGVPTSPKVRDPH